MKLTAAKSVTALVLSVALVGCVTPAERWAKAEADYGPICNSIGVYRGNPQWAACVSYLRDYDDALDQQRTANFLNGLAAAYAITGGAGPSPIPPGTYRMPSDTNSFSCVQQGVFTNCQQMK